jgi:predicted O-linked N-acetylglucosamine transferase (SPINDLY family)
MGFCGTLGADYVQYLIADATVVPPEARPFYTEKVVYMPHSYFVNDHKQVCACVCVRVCVRVCPCVCVRV